MLLRSQGHPRTQVGDGIGVYVGLGMIHGCCVICDIVSEGTGMSMPYGAMGAHGPRWVLE